jgi:hypothetical protein
MKKNIKVKRDYKQEVSELNHELELSIIKKGHLFDIMVRDIEQLRDKNNTKGNIIWILILLLLCIIIGTSSIIYQNLKHIDELSKLNYKNDTINYNDIEELESIFTKIHNNCGSVFITKRYGFSQYSVFDTSNMPEFEKYDSYIPLEVCLR